jgi:hypothetical protein
VIPAATRDKNKDMETQKEKSRWFCEKSQVVMSKWIWWARSEHAIETHLQEKEG